MLSEEGIQVDECEAWVIALVDPGLELAVDGSKIGCLTVESLVALEALVDWEQALQVEVRLGALAQDFFGQMADGVGDGIHGEVVAYIVGSGQQTDGTGLGREYLVETLRDARDVITDDATVDHVLHVESLAPVTTSFSEAVA